MRDYTKIKAWKLADKLTVQVYEHTRSFPKAELYALTSQIRRSAISVAANIVEGSARESKRDYLHFLYMARGSLMETRYFIHLSNRLGYLTQESHQILEESGNHSFACLQGLINVVEKESGKLAKILAKITSLLFVAFTNFNRTY